MIVDSRTGRDTRVVVVTGASSGIGRSLGLRLGVEGYRIGLIARRAGELERVAAEVAAGGGSAVTAVADVADRAGLRAAVAVVEGRFGPVDVMVANAGFGAPTRLDPLNTSDVEQTMRVNILGVVYSIEAVLPGMLARGRGHLLAISSLAAFKGLPGESAYCASKSAVNVYMEGLRIALRTKGVVVTTVCPGFVQTPMTPMESATPFMISADRAAGHIARLISRRRGGVVRFPWPMSILMSILARLPDAAVARLVHAGADPAKAGGRRLIDLALKMLLDEKARFAATVLGVGFAAALVLVQVGLFFGLLENASITIDRLDADLWVTARNTPNVDFGNPFPESYVQRVRSVPGVARADNLIVWYAVVALPSGAKESVVYYGLENFPAWHFPGISNRATRPIFAEGGT